MVFAIRQHELAISIHMSPNPWNPLPPPFPCHPSRLSQSTGFGFPTSYIKLPLAIYFTDGNVYVSMLFYQIKQYIWNLERHGTTDWFKIGIGVWQGCILSPGLFKLYAEYIIWNAGLDEAQAGIKIAKRNINNLIYADDTTLMAESEEELKSLLMKVKEESEKAGLKLNIRKTKIMASSTIISWQIDGETMETVRDFIFLGFKITADGDCSHEM